MISLPSPIPARSSRHSASPLLLRHGAGCRRHVHSFPTRRSSDLSAVTDQMVATLREHLSDAQVVELAALISLENYRSRTNAGLGLTSQGFKEDCDVPWVEAT